MATLDEIQARLSALISRAAEARMLSTQTGPGPDGESTATLAEEIEARLMQDASPAQEDEVLATCTGLLQEGESMPTLTDEIKTFIVNGLVCYDTPSQVAEAVKVNFNVEITRQHVYAYDPNASQHMSPRWRKLHAATRQALLRELAEVGIAHRAVRLRRLDRLSSRCERNNVMMSLKCLEMAAKECGGIYENRKPIVLQTTIPQPQAPQPVEPQPQPQPQPPQPPQPQAVQAPMPPHPTPQPVPPQRSTAKVPAPQPLAVLAQPPQPATPPTSLVPPLDRTEHYLGYVRELRVRDQAVAAQTPLGNARISTVPPAS